ncbi:MAG: hypothetical protein A3J82_02255 [Elusimicrobia bacterium RIFOXYA2_FULL_69_6]|nr:MAG: hypothetical protein A3J82_02255 [Elusimicrobia bacterium RIFOXYA2_FULL_69_6]
MAFRAAGLLLAALLVLPAAAAPKRDRKTADRRKALARLALWVAREGRDRVVEEAEAQVMGLRTSSDVPLRTVARAPGQSPDGRTRAVSLAYNSDGKVIKPVAFVFWRIDVSSSLPAGAYTEGRTFLTGLDGSLARVLSVTEQPPDLGARHISVPVPADAPASAAGLREELDYWLSASR